MPKPTPTFADRIIELPGVDTLRAQGEGEGNTHEITFPAASDEPIERGSGDYAYTEILELNKQTDLSFLKGGTAPLLWQHRHGEPIGTITKAAIKKDGKRNVLEVTVRFFDDVPESAAAWRKVDSEMIANVSVGWLPKKDGLEIIRGDDGEGVVFLYTAVEIFEVSLVSVPADASVGIGRDNGAPAQRGEATPRHYRIPEVLELQVREKIDKIKSEEGIMPKPNTDPEKNVKGKRWLADNEANLRAQHNLTQAEVDTLRALVDRDEGAEKAEVRAAVLDIVEKRAAAPESDPDTGKKTDSKNVEGQRWLSDNESRVRELHGLTPEDITTLRNLTDSKTGCTVEAVKAEAWNLAEKRGNDSTGKVGGADGGKAPAAHLNEHHFNAEKCARDFLGEKEQDGIEKEILDEFHRGIPEGYAPERRGKHSLMIPHSAFLADPVCRKMLLAEVADNAPRLYNAATRAFSVGANPTGFHHEIFDENFFVSALVSKSNVIPLFSMLPQELMQDLVGVTEAGEPSMAWIGEDDETEESTGLSYGNRTLKWRNAQGLLKVNRRTLQQSSMFFPRILFKLRDSLVRTLDKAAVAGSASNAGIPTGIENYTGINTIAVGTNGGALSWDLLTQMPTAIEADNADIGEICFIGTPEIKGQLKRTPRFAGSTGNKSDRILAGGMDGKEMVDDTYRFITSQHLSKSTTKGTGRNLHTLVAGVPSSVEWGAFSGIEIFVDEATERKNQKVLAYASQSIDISPRYVDAWCKISDVNVTL